MSKNNFYGVKASKEQNESINFQKIDGMVHIYLGSSDVSFTVKEAKEISDLLKNAQMSK